MLKTRIIPTLLWKDIGLVKGKAFDSWRRVGSVLPAIKVYNLRQVDELILLDITATNDKHEPDYDSIEQFSSQCFVPFSVGGGIDTVDKIREVLRAGADKVVINTAAYHNIELISEASQMFGKQCIVSSIDYKKGENRCYSCCGMREEPYTPIVWAKRLEAAGAGEIMLCSIEDDGNMRGYDIPTIRTLAENLHIPVIASGGGGTYNDVYKALTIGKADAVAMASMYHFTEQTPLELKKYLRERGCFVRIPE